MCMYLNNFLLYMDTIKGKSSTTIKGYKSDLTILLKFLKFHRDEPNKKAIKIEDISIEDIDKEFLNSITLSDLYLFMAYLGKERNNSSYAKARKVASIKAFFKYLTNKAKIIKENVGEELETPKLEKRNPIHLNLRESEELLRALDPKSKNYKRDKCILTLFLNCGVRISELCGIDIDKIKGDTLTVIGKGDKERTVYLNKSSIRCINDYMEEREKIKVSGKDGKALFISNKGNRISVRAVESLVKKYVEYAGLDSKKYTPHKLRHTCATLMYKHGKVDIRRLQQILGHENIQTTQGYTHVDSEDLRNAVNSNPLDA